MNHTNGMPRFSAYLICLPNFAAFADTSQAIPRARSASATSFAADQPSSFVKATNTAEGTLRLACAKPCDRIRATTRVTPIDRPTPGYVFLPFDASDS